MPRGVTDPIFIDTLVTSSLAALNAFRAGAISAGWTCPISSDGTTQHIPGNPTESLAASRSYFVLRSPAGAGSPEYCFQNTAAPTTNSNSIRIKVSPSAGFTGGSGTQVPAAADQGVLWGSGTDASPTGGNGFVVRIAANTVATYCMGVFDRAAPYGFACWCSQAESSGETNGVPKPRLVHDPVVADRSVADPAPFVAHFAGGATTVTAWAKGDVDGSVAGWNGMARTAAGTMARIQANYLVSSGFAAPTTPTVDPFDSRTTIIPVVYADSTHQIKGVSTLLRWIAQTLPSAASAGRARVFDVEGEAKAYINVGQFAIPWSGNLPTLSGFTASAANIWSFDDVETVTEADPPVISNLSPVDASELDRWDSISFDLADATGLKDVIITCKFEGEADTLLVFDDAGYAGRFARLSTPTVPIVEGDLSAHFVIAPEGGWRKAIESLKVNGFDLYGNKEGT